MTNEPRLPEAYRSALDLPSFRDLLQQIQAGKLLTRVIARDKRPDLLRLEENVRELAARVDRFYEKLGRRHWIFHETLPTDAVDALLDLPSDEAERSLIALYSEPERLDFFIRMIVLRFPAMTVRRGLIDRARQDFQAGRYYAAVLVLLSVMDGFVNEFEPQSRRGLHAREAEEMNAWDSVVSHHLGLANAHKAFTRRFSKTSDEEVFELYRNGIVHGVLLNFDNTIVAAKAWNRLFAVADWATSRLKQAIPPEPEPTWRELLARMRDNQEARRALDEWQPRVLREGEPEFSQVAAHRATEEYLTAWQGRNYGGMAQHLATLVRQGTVGRTAAMIRDACELYDLEGFSIRVIELKTPVLAVVEVDLRLANGTERGILRWIRETESGDMALPNQPGAWRLMHWGPSAAIDRERQPGESTGSEEP